MEIPILYEDKNIVAVNKPAGLVVHSDGRTTEPTLVDWILEKYPQIKTVGEPLTLSSGEVVYRPGIVHRLDRETSGVILIAKDQETFEKLKSQFQERETQKVYNTFVWGEFKDTEGIIDRPIGKSRKDFRLWSAQRMAKGEMRDALTEYKVLAQKDDIAFLEVTPRTGRTHQIRVHMKAINHPVLCDRLYGPKRPKALGFERLALHARSIEFTDTKGEKVKVEAPYPEDFKRAIAQF